MSDHYQAMQSIALSGNCPDECIEMCCLLSYLTYLSMVSQEAHWVAAGDEYYGDHLLFERVYDSVKGLIDPLAEKSVMLFGPEAVQTKVTINHLKCLSDNFGALNTFSPRETAKQLLEICYMAMECIESVLDNLGSVSRGLDNAMDDLSDSLEDVCYLLGQRVDVN